ncbi:MAG: HAD-IB family phosphatase [Anaerolineales bacterium]|nr:HAD-IB family phosphatase [Anaerolineales bacterium]
MLRWTTYDLIFFDCDSTLSTIEGVDELARLKGKEGRVGLLTQKAMDGALDLADVYGKRLKAINPTRGQLQLIEQLYWETLVPDAQAVIDALHFLQKHVFIISGGLADAVQGFGQRLGVDAERIRAVTLEYNELSGPWWRYYDQSAQRGQSYLDYDEGPLTVSAGKAQVVRELAGDLFGKRLLIGDGSSDLATRGNGIDLFVGFGGVVVREKVEQEADVFIYPTTLAPVLPLAAGVVGLAAVEGTPHEAVFRKGLEICQSSGVKFREAEQREVFLQAFAL